MNFIDLNARARILDTGAQIHDANPISPLNAGGRSRISTPKLRSSTLDLRFSTPTLDITSTLEDELRSSTPNPKASQIREQRKAEAARILEKYLDRIPVIVEKAEKSDVPHTNRTKITNTMSKIGVSWEPKLPLLSRGTRNNSKKIHISRQVSIWKHANELVDGLFVPPRDPKKIKKLLKKNMKDSAGQSWFDMPAPTITPELKKDFEILKLRSVIDPKRHFKREGKSKALPKYFQMGTVIEPATQFFSSRLTKKERKTTFADEVLSDQKLKAYRKRKVNEIEEKNRPGVVGKWKNRGRQTMKRAKQRRES